MLDSVTAVAEFAILKKKLEKYKMNSSSSIRESGKKRERKREVKQK